MAFNYEQATVLLDNEVLLSIGYTTIKQLVQILIPLKTSARCLIVYPIIYLSFLQMIHLSKLSFF